MTVSWGGMGTLWHKPVVTVYVRPTRHTWGLLNDHPEFTLNFVPPSMKSALKVCGSSSGRDLDKWSKAQMVPEPSETIAVPRIAGSVLSFECRKMATVDLDPSLFLDEKINGLYPEKDYHRVYFGEVLAIWRSGES